MGKTIQLTRDELVWQTRCISWDAEDYQRYLDWLKSFVDKADKDDSRWIKHHVEEYEFLKQFTWDQICDFINGNYDEEPTLEYSKDEYEWTYRTTPSRLIQENMREDCYNSDIISENYADDYNENWDIMED